MNEILYSLLNKFEAIVDSLSNFAVTAKSSDEIDNTPNKLNLPGEVGDIITKDRYLIYYKSVNSNRFISLSNQFPNLIIERKSILSSGVNRVATWTKGINEWKFTGYTTMNMDENCCIISEKNDVYITWIPVQDTIYYGTPLTNQQLNAVASFYGQNVNGTFKYDPDFNTILTGGEHILNTKFTPEDRNTYNEASKSIKITVNKVTASVNYRLNWTVPDAIIYGTALSDVQLNAKAIYNDAEISGKYIYQPGFGAVLCVGENIPLNCTFYPTEYTNYEVLSASVDIDVTKANIADFVNWNDTYTASCGGMFTDYILNASVGAVDTNYNIEYYIENNVPVYNGYSFPSTFSKDTIHTLTASVTPTNTDDYQAGNYYSDLYIEANEVIINWNIANPSIAYGNVFTTANYFSDITVKDKDGNIISGTKTYFYYNPSTSTYISITPDSTTCSLSPGTITLKCTFTPSVSETCFNITEVEKEIIVIKNSNYIINFPSTQSITYGSSITLNATTTPANIGTFTYYNNDQLINSSTIIPVGTYTIKAICNPTDSTLYDAKTALQTLTISQSDNYDFIWDQPAAINYGDNLANTLNAKAYFPSTSIIFQGTPVYTEGSAVYNENSILSVGTHNITCTFTPSDRNYAVKTLTRTVTVNQLSNYTIEWDLSSGGSNNIRSFISYDKRTVNLSNWRSLVTINLPVSIPGSITFSENSTTIADGSQLSVGTHNITCTFTPSNSTTYATKSITRTIIVSDYCFTTEKTADHKFNLQIIGYRDDITSNVTPTLNDRYSVLYDLSHSDIYNVISINDNAFYDENNSSLSYITIFYINEIDNTITYIGDSAFGGLINVIDIFNYTDNSATVFNNITNIGNNPFINCSKLNPVNINNNNFETNGYTLYYIFEDTQNYKVVTYYEKAIYNYVILNNQVSEIGINAFSNNNTFNKNKLQILIINNNNNSITIHGQSFYNFGNLRTIYFTGYNDIISDNTPFTFDQNDFAKRNYSTVFYYKSDTNTPRFINATYIQNNSMIVGVNETKIIPEPASFNINNNEYVINRIIKFNAYNSSTNNRVNEIVIPYGYNTITGSALSNCKSLETISIPVSISDIDEQYGLCYDAPVLKNINIFPHNNQALTSTKYKVYNNQTTAYNSVSGTPRLPNILFEWNDVPGEVDTYKLITYPIGLSYDNYKLYSLNSSFYVEEVGNYAFYNVGNNNYANSKLKTLYWDTANNTVLKRIGDYAFFGTRFVFDNNVDQTIPRNVEYIGKRAFYNNTNINGVHINKSLRNYGGKVCNAFTMFNNFANLANPYAAIGAITRTLGVSCSTTPLPIAIQDQVGTTITGSTGLNFVSDDQSIYLYQANTVDDDFYTESHIRNLVSMFMFDDADSIVNYMLPASVEIVSDFAGYGMHTMKTLDLSNAGTLNHIGSYAFGNCRSLETVYVSPSVKRIYDGCFAGDPCLHTINLDKCAIQTIGQYSFNKDYSLKNISINFDTASRISVSHEIFSKCTDLRTITLTGTFPLEFEGSTISSVVFDNINNILDTYLYYPEDWTSQTKWNDFELILNDISNTVNGERVKNNKIIISPYKVNNGIHYIINDNDEIEICGIDETTGAVTIASTIESKPVTTIRDYAFVNKSLTKLTIPSSVIKIGKYIVSGCKNLTEFAISGNVNKFNVANNVALYETTDNILYSYAPGASATAYTSSVVTQFRESAFDSCENLTEIYISSDVTKIENRSFYQCSKLERVFVDAANVNFLSTNGTLEGNSNNSDDGILFRLNSSNDNIINLTLLYVPQAIPAHFLRIPSALSVTSNDITINYSVTDIASGAIERTSLNIIILPQTINSIEEYAFVYNNSLNTIIFNGPKPTLYSSTESGNYNFLQDIISNEKRNTELYSTENFGNIQGDGRIYIVNNVISIKDLQNETYYIYQPDNSTSRLLACTVGNTEASSNITVYNNIEVNGIIYSYNEIDNFALANRASSETNYQITFRSANEAMINNIAVINSDILYGSSMINRIDFINTPASVYGSPRMFSLNPTTVINTFGISSGYVDEWKAFLKLNGYEDDTMTIYPLG